MTAITRADKALSTLCHAVFGGHCSRCGSMYATAPHHVQGRAIKALRWKVLNVVLLCYSCHSWAHAYPAAFLRWLAIKLPQHFRFREQNRNPPIEHQDMDEVIGEIKELTEGVGQ